MEMGEREVKRVGNSLAFDGWRLVIEKRIPLLHSIFNLISTNIISNLRKVLSGSH